MKFLKTNNRLWALLALGGAGLLGGALMSGCGGGSAMAGPVVPPNPSGPTGKILFSRDNKLWLINADGTNEHQVPNTQGALRAKLSPDGSTIAFDQNSDVFTSKSDGTNRKQLTNDAKSGSPVWSGDGTQLAFCSGRLLNPSGNRNTDIFTMNADGSNQKVLANTDGNECPANWSPDNLLITFPSNKATGQQDSLFVIGNDGKNQNLLDFTGGEGAFTADSKTIIYPSNGQLNIIDIDGKNKRLFDQTTSLGLAGSPSVSPDGQYVVFLAVQNFQENLYIAKSNGTQPQLLVANATNPSWGGK